MRTHYLQHVEFEGLASLGSWLSQAGDQISHTKLFENDIFPDLEDIDFLIILGGPMSVHDEPLYPWLVAEKNFIRAAITKKIPMLGICLGAQLIAHCLGAKVYPNTQREIGWFPIYATTTTASVSFPAEQMVFHWHGETFELPANATQLARSEACQNQAFLIDQHIIGLQFHLETTPESAAQLLTHCRDELVDAPYIQTEQQIRATDPQQYQQIHHLMHAVLSYLRQPKP